MTKSYDPQGDASMTGVQEQFRGNETLDHILDWHPGVSGSDESIALIPKDQVPREEYGPHMKMARAIVAEYQKNWEELRDETRITDVWSVAEDILRLRIAEAIARASRTES